MIRISSRRVARGTLAAFLLPIGACAFFHAESGPSHSTVAGTWAYVARSGPSDSTLGTLTIVEHTRGLSGAIRMSLPDTVSTNIRVNVEGAQIYFAAPTRAASPSARPQNQFFSVVATPNADHTMTGLWNRDGHGGKWTATRLEPASR